MSKAKNTATKPLPEDAVLTAVDAHPGAATEGIAGSAGVARSTASKALSRLADAGKVVRHEGGRENGKRLPDRWTLSGIEMPAAYSAHVRTPPGADNKRARPAPTRKPARKADTKPAKQAVTSAAKGKPGKRSSATKSTNAGADEQPERLRAFGLDPLVLTYVDEHSDSAPHGPAAVAKAIQRSSGAVANCMKRLAERDKLRKVSDKPLRYDKIAA